MEGLIAQKVTPLLKCFVLFLFIFTAKVLTSRPHDSNDARNGIQHVKPSHYVRTFTKYHHRRTIQWNNQDISNYWPLTHEQSKSIEKRNTPFTWPEIENKNAKEEKTDTYTNHEDWPVMRSKRSLISDLKTELIENSNLNNLADVRENLPGFEKTLINLGKIDQKNKNGVLNEAKKYKVKNLVIPTDPPTTMGPTISCLYKINSISMSPTPSYIDDKSAQFTVENDHFETGPVSEQMLSSGPNLVEKCNDTRATCYTLWHQDKEGNITVLGQGCWRASDSQTEGQSPCNKCTRVTARPDTKFCCCTGSYCNADFTSLKEEAVTIKAESTMKASERSNDQYAFLYMYLFPALLVAGALLIASLYYDLHCRKRTLEEDTRALDLEKGEVMGSGPDALATGLSCVDNLALIEHIGQGKFGSVWRGSLGSTPVAVKLYSNASTWQKEAAIYAMPHLSHPNILRYYGSETRQTLTSGYGREHLIVLELCSGTLRARLERAPLSWRQFAEMAHGLAAALAHLHTPSGSKPCIVHRDVNSNNVLVTSAGACRLADLGLAQALHPRHRAAPPTRITEAGTLRYLAPEALEGALDLTGAGAALCAVDVYALGLVLWEMVWRTHGAHAGPVPAYMLPYQDRAHAHTPTLHTMQTVVSRNKMRPPLPTGPVVEARALKIATDTCDECWDHDAEARLTAVCVEERMSELKQLVCAPPPRIHDNMLHPPAHQQGDGSPSQPEADKNSNCTSSQACDVTTPLLYPQPHIGRNACIERNTHSGHQHTLTLIHKSLKDITAPVQSAEPRVTNEENVLSVARTSHTRIIPENSLNEIRSYQRPLEYVQNDVSTQDSDRAPKQTNLYKQEVKVEKPKWGIRKFFEKFNKKMETEVKLVPENSQRTKTSIVENGQAKPVNSYERPSNLVLNHERNFNFEAPCLSPPNRTLSPTMMGENVLGFKELPPRENEPKTNQIFAVIVPKAKPADFEIKAKNNSSESVNKSVRTSMTQSMFKSNSESEDSTVKKRLSCDNKILNSASSSRASINLELQYIDNAEYNNQISPFDLNSDCSSSEDEHLMLLSEDGGSKITMQSIPKNDVLKESQTKAINFNKVQNKYTNFDNEFSDPNDKENVNGYSGDNPVYLAALKGEIETDLRLNPEPSPKPCLKHLSIKRQHSLEQVSELFSSAGDINLLNPAGRVKTPGDLPVAVRRARSRALQKGRASESNRLSLYDDRMMFGNSL